MKTTALEEVLKVMQAMAAEPKWPLVDEARAELAALSSVPEDVARDVETCAESMSEHDLDALDRLATAAARVPGLMAEMERLGKAGEALHAEAEGLEQRCATMDGALVSLREYVKSVESERDAARQEAETLHADVKWRTDKLAATERTAGNLRAKVAELEARVAERDEDFSGMQQKAHAAELSQAEAWSTLRKQKADLRQRAEAAEARATAAEAKVKTLEERGQLVAGLKLAESRVTELERQVERLSREARVQHDAIDEAETRAAAAEKDAAYWRGQYNAMKDHAEAPRPAPATGLREAVGPFVAHGRHWRDGVAAFHTHGEAPLVAEHWRDLVSAYDATPGASACPCTGGYACQPGTGGCEVKGASTPPVVDLAAVVEALDGLVTFLAEDEHWTNPANADEYAALYNAREVLRRVTGGEAPEVLLKSRVAEVLAAHWTAATEMAEVDAEPGSSEAAWTTATIRDALGGVADDLGLTLPTGPGGGETGDPDADAVARMSDAEVEAELKAAGVDVPAFLERTRAHVEKVRASLPPDSPYSKADPSHAPEQPAATPDAAAESWARNERENDARRREVVARRRRPEPTPDVPAMAQPEPAAPEVVWEGEGVRMLKDGTALVMGPQDWTRCYDERITSLARALAEAMRELGERIRPEGLAAVRKSSAEAMRRRAEGVLARIAQKQEAAGHGDVATVLDVAREDIRALPLE